MADIPVVAAVVVPEPDNCRETNCVISVKLLGARPGSVTLKPFRFFFLRPGSRVVRDAGLQVSGVGATQCIGHFSDGPLSSRVAELAVLI